jgi:putative endonuclease
MKRFTSQTQQIGEIGEHIACKYLVKQGFQVIGRNYTKKIGEIDIICTKDSVIHFVEVKTIVTRVTGVNQSNVSRETSKNGELYNPFENITKHKLRKLSRTIEWYLAEKRVSRETRWQIDAIAVILNYNTRIANVNVLWNVVDC